MISSLRYFLAIYFLEAKLQIAKRVVYESVNDESRYSTNEMPSVEMDDFLKTMDLKTVEYKMSVKF